MTAASSTTLGWEQEAEMPSLFVLLSLPPSVVGDRLLSEPLYYT